jgi:hypothetical protein
MGNPRACVRPGQRPPVRDDTPAQLEGTERVSTDEPDNTRAGHPLDSDDRSAAGDGGWSTHVSHADPRPVPDDVNDIDIALVTGEELLALIASALIRQQQEVIELRDALGAAMRDNTHLRARLCDAKGRDMPDIGWRE